MLFVSRLGENLHQVRVAIRDSWIPLGSGARSVENKRILRVRFDGNDVFEDDRVVLVVAEVVSIRQAGALRREGLGEL